MLEPTKDFKKAKGKREKVRGQGSGFRGQAHAPPLWLSVVLVVVLVLEQNRDSCFDLARAREEGVRKLFKKGVYG